MKYYKPNQFFLIGGPCVIEGEEMLMKTAETVKKITSDLKINYVFKASFDKANRSSIGSFRGPGMQEGLRLLEKVKKTFEIPILTDIHTPEMIAEVKDVVDIVQLPAFLARQTDFYLEAAKQKVTLNVKKGQFMSPYEMKQAVAKFKSSGGDEIYVTERGTFFGYGNLVVDFRSIKIIRDLGIPYIYDATHSLQLPAANGESSGGQREFIPSLAKGQVAAGADGIFMEIHPDPSVAMCDKENQWPLDQARKLITELNDIYKLVRGL